MIFTPRQFTHRAELYHQLGQLTAAGLGVPRALDQLQRHPPSRAYRQPLRALALQLGKGSTIAESLRGVHGWLPEFDIALIDAGERSGRLDSCFRLLAGYYTDRARVARQILGGLVYPVLLFHLAVLIFPFADFFLYGNGWLYLAKTFGVLLPLYAVVIALLYAGQSQHGESWRAMVERVLRLVPVAGKARQYLALARLAAALEALLAAGVAMFEAWELAGRACGSPALRRAVAAWKPALLEGETPADCLNACPLFPEMFANLYSTGEVSGQLEDALRRLRDYYQEEGTRKIQAVAQWLPHLVYFAVALMIGYKIVSFWSGYFRQIQDAGGF